jgi:hypothetical protein
LFAFPVAVSPADIDNAIFGQLGENSGDSIVADIIAIDEQSDVLI